MIPKKLTKLTKSDFLLAADAAAAWPREDFAEWTVDSKEGFRLTVEDARVGHG